MFKKITMVSATVLLFLSVSASASEALNQAVKDGNLDRVRALVSQSANINYLDANGKSPLSEALGWWKPAIAEYLLSLPGINPKIKKTEQWSSLMWACFRLSSKGWEPYYRPLIKKILQKGSDINYTAYAGVTALMLAASAGDMEIVQLLVRYGADRTKIDSSQRNAAEYAKRAGHILVYNYLEGKDSSTYLQSLIYAVKEKKSDQINRLVQAHSGINDREETTRRTALIYAAQQGDTQVVRQLLAAGAQVNLQDKNGVTALMQSINYEHREIALILINAGANVNLRTNKDDGLCWQSNASALEYAVCRRMTDVVDALLNKGARVDQQNDPVWNTLFYLTLSSNVDTDLVIARKLVAAGARPTEQLFIKEQQYAAENAATAALIRYLQPYRR